MLLKNNYTHVTLDQYVILSIAFTEGYPCIAFLCFHSADNSQFHVKKAVEHEFLFRNDHFQVLWPWGESYVHDALERPSDGQARESSERKWETRAHLLFHCSIRC